MHGFKQLLSVAAVDGAALANSTAETSLLPAPAKIALLKNFFDRAGKRLVMRAAGRISTVVTTPGTLTFRAKFGSIVVFNGGAINLNVTAQVNASWELAIEMIVRALGDGTTANLLGIGRWTSRAIVGAPAAASGGVESIVLPDTAPAVGSGFDSTAEQAVDLTAQWSVANASNSIQLHQYSLATFD